MLFRGEGLHDEEDGWVNEENCMNRNYFVSSRFIFYSELFYVGKKRGRERENKKEAMRIKRSFLGFERNAFTYLNQLETLSTCHKLFCRHILPIRGPLMMLNET